MARAKRSSPTALTADQLRRTVDPATLGFATTADVAPLATTIGQPRALEAIAFGVAIRAEGMNLFVAGAPGSGRESTVLEVVHAAAAERVVPPDWIYVHSFTDPDRPIAISLPPGRGRAFAGAMSELIESFSRGVLAALSGEEIQKRRDAIVAEGVTRRGDRMGQLQEFASTRDFGIQLDPTGITTFPLEAGKPIPADQFPTLPKPRRDAIERAALEVQAEIASALRVFKQIDEEVASAIRALEQELIGFITRDLFASIRQAYGASAELMAFVAAVEADLPEHLHDFWPPLDGEAPGADVRALQRAEHLRRYEVNVLIDNGATEGAPVLIERNPTVANLVGRVDYRAVMGALVTDHRQIKSGALHRANGGYLILRITDLLRSPLSWDTLKRALLCREIETESVADQLGTVPTARLRPIPVPLDVKVVLIGPRELHQALYHGDEDFAELFAVRADFAPEMDWDAQHQADYAGFISRLVREQQLRHFDAAAVARVIEFGARAVDDQRKLSTRFLRVANLVTEASFWAERAGHDPVTAVDVETAIEKRVYRANLAETRVREAIEQRTISIETSGGRIGQVNGLTVIDLGDYAFGSPSRITARVAVGEGAVQSIEREIELSGPIHSKGVLTLAGYLNGQYGRDWPLALAATLTFEQSYGGIEGDSASSAELYALLSALSELPIDQAIAVTGSVNQFGEVQAVGGVTEKVEGFFAVCQQRGLTGDQGVLVPASNVPNLMLREEVVQAVRDGQFHVWAVEHIDSGIELLMGRPAGTRGRTGAFPKESVHALVEARLRHFLEAAREHGAAARVGAAKRGVKAVKSKYPGS
jgi:predicted ATP-dependent protease